MWFWFLDSFVWDTRQVYGSDAVADVCVGVHVLVKEVSFQCGGLSVHVMYSR